MKAEIWLIENADECHDAKTGKAIPYYTFNGPDHADGGKVLAKHADKATLDDLTHLCDQDAENGNHHSFVGVHAALGKLIQEKVGMETATKIMREVAYRGGLHEMAEG